jgi:hypothetical protein
MGILSSLKFRSQQATSSYRLHAAKSYKKTDIEKELKIQTVQNEVSEWKQN